MTRLAYARGRTRSSRLTLRLSLICLSVRLVISQFIAPQPKLNCSRPRSPCWTGSMATPRVPSAYLSERKAEAAGDRELPGGDTLHSADVAHTVAEPGAQARRRSGAKPPARSAQRGRRSRSSVRHRRERRPRAGSGARPKSNTQRKASGSRGIRGQRARPPKRRGP